MKKTIKKLGRPAKSAALLLRIKKLGIFKSSDAKRIGISKSTLQRMVFAGQIDSLRSGYFVHPKSTLSPEDYDFAIACAKFGPDAAIGGMSALFYHNLTEQVPKQIWVLVPYGRKTKEKLYHCIRTNTDPKKGVENRSVYRITSIERTIVEAFRYASKIGLRTALRAARTAIAGKQTTLDKIYRQAKELGMEKLMQKHWETLIPESQAHA